MERIVKEWTQATRLAENERLGHEEELRKERELVATCRTGWSVCICYFERAGSERSGFGWKLNRFSVLIKSDLKLDLAEWTGSETTSDLAFYIQMD